MAETIMMIPGMMGAAWATLSSCMLMLLMSYVASQRVYPIPYEWRRLIVALFSAVPLLLVASMIGFQNLVFEACFKAALLGAYPLVLVLFRVPTKVEMEVCVGLMRRLRPS